MRLELFVSRAFNGRVRTRKLYASRTHPDDGGGDGKSVYYDFYSSQFRPPVTHLYLEEYFRAESVRDIRPDVHLTCSHTTDKPPTVGVQFLLEGHHGEGWGMKVEELLEYLEHGVDWE